MTRTSPFVRQLLLLAALLMVATGLSAVMAPPAQACDATQVNFDYCSEDPAVIQPGGPLPPGSPPPGGSPSGPTWAESGDLDGMTIYARCEDWGANARFFSGQGWYTDTVRTSDGGVMNNPDGTWAVPGECVSSYTTCSTDMASDGLVIVKEYSSIPEAGKSAYWRDAGTSEACTYRYETQVCPVALFSWRFYGTPGNPTTAATVSRANNPAWANGGCGLEDDYSIPAYSPHDAGVDPSNAIWGVARGGIGSRNWYQGLNYSIPAPQIIGSYGTSCTALQTTTMRDLLEDPVTSEAYGTMLGDAYNDLYSQFRGYLNNTSNAAAAARSHMNLNGSYGGGRVTASHLNNVPCDSSLEFMKRANIDDDGEIEQPIPNTVGACFIHLRSSEETRIHKITGAEEVTSRTEFLDTAQNQVTTSARYQQAYTNLALSSARSTLGYSPSAGAFASSLSCFDVDAAVAQEGCVSTSDCDVVEEGPIPSTIYTVLDTPGAGSAVGAYDPITVRTHIDDPARTEFYCYHPDRPGDRSAEQPCDVLYPDSQYRPRISSANPFIRATYPGTGQVNGGEPVPNDLAGKAEEVSRRRVGTNDTQLTMQFYEAGENEFVRRDYSTGGTSEGSFVQLDPAGQANMYSFRTIRENVDFVMPLLMRLSASREACNPSCGNQIRISESADVATDRVDHLGVPISPYPNTDDERQFPVLDGVIEPRRR